MTENEAVKISDKPEPQGFIDSRKVKAVAFSIITLCVLFGVVVSILAIWDFAQQGVLYRTLATLGVISLGMLLFSIINDRFGG
ncbi:MAG: hypothetical protein ABIA75_06085 [Candidatus Neomarinimicrobiota bacterium]